MNDNKTTPDMKNETTADLETATFGGGCFWCLDAAYRQLDGVKSVESGYMGGEKQNPTYEEVCSGTTNHAEVVQIKYDPSVITYTNLLEWFWKLHDPTQLNRQGNDIGTQYRSVIFYNSPEQKTSAEESIREEQEQWGDKPIVTTLEPAQHFWKAEDYHQDYYSKNASKNPYCTYVIKPKLKKAKLKD